MKKLLLLLILSFFSTQGLAASCSDGSEPTRSVSADGSYYVYNCGNTKNDKIIKALIEIKPHFQKKWDVNVAKWDACQKHCDKKKMEFKVLTERELF